MFLIVLEFLGFVFGVSFLALILLFYLALVDLTSSWDVPAIPGLLGASLPAILFIISVVNLFRRLRDSV